MNRAIGRVVGMALLRRPWAGRLALAWGARRVMRAATRGGGRLAFLGGLGVGAGLMYLLAARPSPAPRAAAKRSPAPRRPSGAPRSRAKAKTAPR